MIIIYTRRQLLNRWRDQLRLHINMRSLNVVSFASALAANLWPLSGALAGAQRKQHSLERALARRSSKFNYPIARQPLPAAAIIIVITIIIIILQ